MLQKQVMNVEAAMDLPFKQILNIHVSGYYIGFWNYKRFQSWKVTWEVLCGALLYLYILVKVETCLWTGAKKCITRRKHDKKLSVRYLPAYICGWRSSSSRQDTRRELTHSCQSAGKSPWIKRELTFLSLGMHFLENITWEWKWV